MDNKQLYHIFDMASLIQKYVRGTLTTVEREALDGWLAESPIHRSLFDEVVEADSAREFEEIYRSVDTSALLESFKKRYVREEKKTIFPLFKWLPYIAALLIAATVFGWILYENRFSSGITVADRDQNIIEDIQPGGNRATLTLSDGSVINLNEDQSGIVVADEGISYQNGGDKMIDVSKVEELVLTTPRGGTYAVTLSDGTKVWLNAASTLKYPTRFDGEERVVELSGEAYFDVAKVESFSKQGGAKRMLSFKVRTKGQWVEVLGTAFNITGYDDEEDIRTTLVEGSVRLIPGKGSSPVLLKPGEQGTVDKEAGVEIRSVDTEKYTAWKNGYFYYKNTPVPELMKHVEKWYDVEVEYKNKIPQETFSGKIKRSTSLMGLIEILRVSTINVELKGKKLIVY